MTIFYPKYKGSPLFVVCQLGVFWKVHRSDSWVCAPPFFCHGKRVSPEKRLHLPTICYKIGWRGGLILRTSNVLLRQRLV